MPLKRFNSQRKVKMGMRVIRENAYCYNNSMPAINGTNGDKILVEIYFRFFPCLKTTANGYGITGFWRIYNTSDSSQRIENTSSTHTSGFGFNLHGSSTKYIKFSHCDTNSIGYTAIFIDGTSSVDYRIYVNGCLDKTGTETPNVDLSSTCAFQAGNWCSPTCVFEYYYLILSRLTYFTSAPPDEVLDKAIKRMWMRPMELDKSLRPYVGAVASQWDFEDLSSNSDATFTTVYDHGIIGGYNLTSNVNLQTYVNSRYLSRLHPVEI